MSLMKCKECGKQISDKAKACPSCGYVPRRTSLFTWIVTIILAIGFLPAVISSFTNYSNQANDSTHETEFKVPETSEQLLERNKRNEEIQKEIAEKKRKTMKLFRKPLLEQSH